MSEKSSTDEEDQRIRKTADSDDRSTTASPPKPHRLKSVVRKVTPTKKRKLPTSAGLESKTAISEKRASKRRKKSTSESEGSKAGKSNSFNDDDAEERFTFFFTKKYVFSNHYPCTFIVDGRTHNCTEQYYMYKKATHFNDKEMARKILQETDPKKMKTLGKQVRGFDKKEWDKETVSRRYMREANFAKYDQNPDLRAQLLATKGTTLVESNPRDNRWGIGLSMNNPKALKRSTWRGKNWLGQLLTKLREEFAKPAPKKAAKAKKKKANNGGNAV